MIFSYFDPVQYTASTINKGKKVNSTTITEIFRDYKGYFDRTVVNFTLQSYYIQGAPRPEYLSYQLYGNSQFYWVLLMCNNVYDPFNGWIKSEQAVFDAADQAYQNIGGEQVLYHKNAKGDKYYNLEEYPTGSQVWYDKGDDTRQYPQYNGALIPIDIYQDFSDKNEALRQIKIVSPDDIESFISSLLREMEKAPSSQQS